jgi:DNA-directed RNA polymerase subunit RPC12/RpoP
LLEQGEEAAKIRKERSFATSKAVPIALVSVLALLLAANILFALRGRRKQVKEETFFHYWCPKCGRKLRYRERQIGRLARCPLCERPIVFPKPAGMPATRWTKLRRLLRLPEVEAKRES